MKPIIFLLTIPPPDGGPVYAETNLEHIIAEPWNALSSLLYLVPALYWWFKLRGKFGSYPFITFAIPLLMLGGLGSAAYHAFRQSPFFLFLDVFPMSVLVLSVSLFFWIRIFDKWWKPVIFIVIPIYILMFMSHRWLDPDTSVNVSYLLSGINIFLPVVLVVRASGNYKAGIIALAIVFFLLGLLFRRLDIWMQPVLPMGSHFLWHASTALGAFYLAQYIYHYRNFTISLQQEKKKAA